MRKIKIRSADNKFKKWFKHLMVAVCCVVILGIGVSGICVSGLYPYSEITFSSISTFIDGETSDITIKTNQAPTLDLAFERLQIQIKNHNGAKNVTSLDESWFAPYQEPDDITPPPIGSAEWGVYTDSDYSMMEHYFYINPENDTLNCHRIPESAASNITSFNIYIFCELFFYQDSSYNFDNLLLITSPIKIILVHPTNPN